MSVASIPFRCQWCCRGAFPCRPAAVWLSEIEMFAPRLLADGLSMRAEAQPFLHRLPVSVSLVEIALMSFRRYEELICALSTPAVACGIIIGVHQPCGHLRLRR